MDIRASLFTIFLHVSVVSTSAVPNDVPIDNDLVLKLLNRVDHLETTEKERETEVKMLRGTVQDLNERLADMDTLRDTIRELTERLAVLETLEPGDNAVDDYDAHVTYMDAGGYDVDGTTLQDASFNDNRTEDTQTDNGLSSSGYRQAEIYEQFAKKPRTRRQSDTNTNGVAFYAVIDTHHLQNLGANQRLEFDRVVTNIGNAYHPNLGVFMCPVSGLYEFSTSLMGINHHDAHYYISHNGQAVANLLLHGSDSYLVSSSRTVVLYLNKGDEVSVNNTNVTEGVFGYQFSSFSGARLSCDCFDNAIVG